MNFNNKNIFKRRTNDAERFFQMANEFAEDGDYLKAKSYYMSAEREYKSAGNIAYIEDNQFLFNQSMFFADKAREKAIEASKKIVKTAEF